MQEINFISESSNYLTSTLYGDALIGLGLVMMVAYLVDSWIPRMLLRLMGK